MSDNPIKKGVYISVPGSVITCVMTAEKVESIVGRMKDGMKSVGLLVLGSTGSDLYVPLWNVSYIQVTPLHEQLAEKYNGLPLEIQALPAVWIEHT